MPLIDMEDWSDVEVTMQEDVASFTVPMLREELEAYGQPWTATERKATLVERLKQSILGYAFGELDEDAGEEEGESDDDESDDDESKGESKGGSRAGGRGRGSSYDMGEELRRQTVVQLRDELEARGLAWTSKDRKAALIERVLAADEEQDAQVDRILGDSDEDENGDGDEDGDEDDGDYFPGEASEDELEMIMHKLAMQQNVEEVDGGDDEADLEDDLTDGGNASEEDVGEVVHKLRRQQLAEAACAEGVGPSLSPSPLTPIADWLDQVGGALAALLLCVAGAAMPFALCFHLHREGHLSNGACQGFAVCTAPLALVWMKRKLIMAWYRLTGSSLPQGTKAAVSVLGPAPGKFLQTTHGLTHYILEGPAEGPLVVLQHGLGSSATVWDLHDIAGGLVEAGNRVLRYDLYDRGWSETDAKAYRVEETGIHGLRFDLDMHVQQMEDVLAALGLENERLVHFGHSTGGAVGIEFARRHPARSAGLALVDAVCLPTHKREYS